jgi:hypothetical protein
MISQIQDPDFRECFEQVFYWYSRFELSREIDHFDTANEYAVVVREYLPFRFKNLSVRALFILYLLFYLLFPSIDVEA